MQVCSFTFCLQFEVLNDPHNAQVGLGSAIGFGTARALAQLYDYIASGGSVGNRILLPADIVKELMKSRTDSLPSRLKFTVGLMITKNVAVRKGCLSDYRAPCSHP